MIVARGVAVPKARYTSRFRFPTCDRGMWQNKGKFSVQKNSFSAQKLPVEFVLGERAEATWIIGKY